MASTGEMVLFFLAIFGILSLSFGQTVQVGDTQNTLSAITAPILSPTQIYQQLIGSGTCAPSDFLCQITGNNIAVATALIAVVIGYIPYLLFTLISRLLDFGVFINQISQNPTGVGSIPFGTIFLAGLLLFVLFDIVKIIRGNPGV